MPLAAQSLTPSEAAGRRIYHEGVSESGRAITAEVGMAGSTMPGHVLTCANCHGADGLGRAEAGVVPPPITWSELTKSYGHVHENGRRHPPFDEAGLAKAVTTGLDPAGNRMEPAMPRFDMHRDDLRDLIAYLKRLESDLDPGISDGSIRIGTLLPESGPTAEAAKVMRQAIEAVFADANASGGVYGRKLELVARSHPPGPDATVSAARALVEKDRVLALLSPFALGAEAALASLAEERRVPVVGPFTVRGPEAAGGRYTFYLFSGLAQQAEVLVAFGLERQALAKTPLAIVHPDDAASAAAAQAAEARCAKKGCPTTLRLPYSEGAFDAAAIVARAREAKTGAVLFLGPAPDLERLAAEAARADWIPDLLSPGMLGARAAGRLPPRFAGRLFLAYPTFPASDDSGGDDPFGRFVARHGLRSGATLPAFSGYLAASLFVDALQRAGRALGRERLVATLEATTEYRTGLAQPLRFGPQRRIGALGGHVVMPAVDAAGFRAASGWITLD